MEVIQCTNTANQRLFVLNELRKADRSTLDFRAMGICSPAPRVRELRQRGFDILTTMIEQIDNAGVTHKVANYTLIGEPPEQKQQL